METADCIIEGLYLGGVMAALNENDLQAKKITHILSVDEKPLPEILTNKYTYKHVFALDLYDFDLLSFFPECLAFIDQARESEGSVLVHCQAGMSRSATVVTGYLMFKYRLAKEAALEKVLSVRQLVRPNEGFQHQLQLFENMGSQLDKTHAEYRAYLLNKLAVKFKCGQYAGGVPDMDIPAEVFVQPDYSAKGNNFYYKCRKCRMFLFHDGAVTSHAAGQGESAFDWRSKVPANKRVKSGDGSEVEEVMCQRSLFVDPLAWMKGKILEVQGKVHCPKCDAKIGSYVWYGEKCPCGAWVAPAFHIDSGKVDRIPSQPVVPHTHQPAAPVAGAAAAAAQPHVVGAVAAFPSSSGRPLNRVPLSETTTAAARLSSAQPVAAVQPRVAAPTPTSAAIRPTATATVQSMETGDSDPVMERRSDQESRDIETGINSIHMDVDSG